VSWSYHWLLGHEQFWNSQLGWCQTPSQPLTGINAHLFKKNYCAGYQEWESFILNDNNNLLNCSMYGGGIRNGHGPASDQDYARCLQFASQHAPLILCVESANDPWYFLYNRTINLDTADRISQHELDVFQNSNLTDFLSKYFSDSVDQFDKNIWDLRELIALNFEHFRVNNDYINAVDRTIQHLWIDSKELWYHGEYCMDRICRYVNKTIVNERLQHWRMIYKQWQSIQLQILQFNWYLPVIVDSIIHNYNFDIDFLNLTLLQEAVIQGQLIKKHNLNLQCYGLEKFPSNTKNLHALLEENTHQ
jgi:hypothetical protein